MNKPTFSFTTPRNDKIQIPKFSFLNNGMGIPKYDENPVIEPKEEVVETGLLPKIRSTINDINASLAVGLYGTLEGWVDEGIGVVGKIGSLFGADTQWAENAIRFDATNWLMNETFLGKMITGGGGLLSAFTGKNLNETRKESFLEGNAVGDYTRNISEAIGGMLPSIIIGKVGGGSVGSTLSFGIATAGGGTEEALNEGATFDQAMLYGTMVGALETGIEWISGGLGGTGAGLLEKAIPSVAKKMSSSLIAKVAINFLGEGAEEMASEFLTPYIKRMIYDEDAPLATKEQYLESFLIGGFTGFIMGGSVEILTPKGIRVGEQIQELAEQQTKTTNPEQIKKNNEEIKRLQTIFEKELLKAGIDSDVLLAETYRQGGVENETNFIQTLSNMNEQTRNDYITRNNLGYRYDAKTGTETDTYKNYTQEQKDMIERNRKLIDNVNKRTKLDMKMVVDNALSNDVGAFILGDTIVINPNVDSTTLNKTVAVHEAWHLIEDTKNGIKLQNREINRLKDNGTYKKTFDDYYERYSSNRDVLDFWEKNNFNENEKRLYIEKEMVGDFVRDNLFDKKSAIDNLAKENTSLAKKVLSWVKNKIATINENKTKTKEDIELEKYLKKSEKLYSDALNEVKKIMQVETKKFALSSTKTQQQDLNNASAPSEISTNTKDIIMTTINSSKPKDNHVFLKEAIKFTDAQAGIVVAGKALGIEEKMKVLTNNARASKSAGDSHLSIAQFDKDGNKIGKSWVDVWKQVPETNKLDFFDYLLHNHNIDRMAQNKPVFGEEITAEYSKEQIKEMDKQYPEFKTIANDVWKYTQNNLKMRLEYGLINKNQYDIMTKMYPHYVPTYRNLSLNNTIGSGITDGLNTDIAHTIKTATGSSSPIMPIDVMMARQTMQIISAGRVNLIANEISKQLESGKKSDLVTLGQFQQNTNQTVEMEVNTDELLDFDYTTDFGNHVAVTGNNIYTGSVSFYKNGVKAVLGVNPLVAEGFGDLINRSSNKSGIANSSNFVKITKWFNKMFKNLTTNFNPFFTFRNAIRDFQDAGMYTKYGMSTFIKNYKTAIKEVRSNSERWQQYRGQGGGFSSIFNYETGVNFENLKGNEKAQNNVLKKIARSFESVNEFIETIPRFAEYISSLEAGNNVETALYDASEVTVNFGRSGTYVRTLNNTVIPYLNAQVQGFIKMKNVLISQKSLGAYASLAMKAFILGILPSVLNKLLYDDDEDYIALKQDIKDNYYLIKIGDDFVRIPKGRMTSILSSTVNRMTNQLSSDEQKREKEGLINAGYLNNVLNEISPVNGFRTIFSPITDVKTNTTWYGGKIESAKFDNISPQNRYDESTSSIAVVIGKITGLSPKKIHYLLDQYTGVVGDIILPMTTSKEEKSIMATNFITDPTTQNKYSEYFYDYLQEATYKRSEGDNVAKGTYRYLNSVKQSVSDLYEEQRTIQSRNDLTRKEKQEMTDSVQILINNTFKSSVENAKLLEKTLSKFELSDESFDDDYREALYMTFGAEFALKHSNSFTTQTYEKAQLLSKLGISYDIFYNAYLNTKDSFKGVLNDNGNTILGSKQKQVFNYVQNIKGINYNQKQLLYRVLGYSNKNTSKAMTTIFTQSGIKLTAEEKDLLKSLIS